MNRKKTIFLTSILVFIPMIVGLILWNKLPEQIPVHFNAAGDADQYGAKAFVVLGIPLLLWVLHLLSGFLILADPKRQNINDKVFLLILYTVPGVGIFSSVLMYPTALNIPVSVNMIGSLFVGIVFLFVGNYLPKSKQNYTVGIKLPWTLNDTENWNKTHRFAGVLWTLCGVALLISAFLEFILLAPILIAVAILLPTAYSFLFYIKKNGSNPENNAE